MIILLAASAITLTASQASIAGPTDKFRGCLREAVKKATTDKVTGDGIETYLKTTCGAEMSTLKGAVITFRTKNGMSHKAAADDAEMTVEDYVGTQADNYKFMANMDKAAVAPQKPAVTPAVTPAAAPARPPAQPPKP